jgi:histidinol-phosphatase
MAQGDAFGPAWSAGLRRGTSVELERWLQFAHAACDEADRIAREAFETELDVHEKTDGSFVTEADRAIEQMVRARLADEFPDHGVVGEEYGISDAGAATRWLLDPIDGTHNFMRGVPLFGTLLAVERDGEVQAGVISAPALGRRWFASRGGGAWITSSSAIRPGAPRRLRVSTVDALGQSQILFRSVTDMRASRVATGFDALLARVWRERGFGDFWGYALVAEGAAEAFMEQDLGPWDLAAPWIVVEEAGGRITDFDGRRSLATGEALASNGTLHAQVLAALWGNPSGEEQPPAR